MITMDSEPAKNRDSDPAKDMDSDPAKDNGSERIRNRSTVPNNKMSCENLHSTTKAFFFASHFLYLSSLYIIKFSPNSWY